MFQETYAVILAFLSFHFVRPVVIFTKHLKATSYIYVITIIQQNANTA